MSSTLKNSVPTGRKKIAQGKERSDAVMGHDSPYMSSPEGAKEIGGLPNGWRWVRLGEIANVVRATLNPILHGAYNFYFGIILFPFSNLVGNGDHGSTYGKLVPYPLFEIIWPQT